jgi:transcriptional regulator with XRE-family HTH domain
MLMTAAMRLADWLKKEGKTQGEFADACGVSQGAISQLIAGGWISQGLAAKIKKLTKGQVTADDFLPATESPRTAPRTAARRIQARAGAR